MAVIHSFDQLRSNNLPILNSANVVLIPKKKKKGQNALETTGQSVSYME
jgi:hypothetical protein